MRFGDLSCILLGFEKPDGRREVCVAVQEEVEVARLDVLYTRARTNKFKKK